MTPSGVVSTLAGSPGVEGSADGTGSAARFNGPTGVAVDSSGNVYVADTENHTIRKVTPGGVVTTLAGTAGVFGSADGTGSAAKFNHPFRVAVDSSGNVYVADTDNHTIRKVTPGGVVTTLAGSAGVKGSADGSVARFKDPSGVAVDSRGNVYVGDTSNLTIRKVTPGGMANPLAGTAGVNGVRFTPRLDAAIAAQDIKTKDGKLYKKATITAATDAYVTVSHDDGLARIFLENLPDELQKYYGYDQKKADQHMATEAQAQAEAARQRQLANFDKASVFVSGSISQVLNGSIMFRGQADTVVIGLRVIPDLILIVGSFDGSVDGDPWKGRIWPAGTHSYNSVGAGVRTIQRWATTREAAIALQTK